MTYKERKKNNRTPLVVTFNRRLPKLKDLVEESWNILGINETIGQKFTEKPLFVIEETQIYVIFWAKIASAETELLYGRQDQQVVVHRAEPARILNVAITSFKPNSSLIN